MVDSSAGVPAGELVEIVDTDGTVIETTTRAEMRRRIARHRCTYVVVRSSRDEVLVHQRADWKDVWPSRWDLAFGGVVGVGEGWHDSAVRELEEEAGVVSTELVDHGPVRWDGVEGALIGQVYSVMTDGPFRHDDGEVVATEWIPRNELESLVGQRPWCLDSKEIVLPIVLSWSS